MGAMGSMRQKWECKTCNIKGMTKEEALIHRGLHGHRVSIESKEKNGQEKPTR